MVQPAAYSDDTQPGYLLRDNRATEPLLLLPPMLDGLDLTPRAFDVGPNAGRQRGFFLCRYRAMAAFVLYTAATRTRLIATDFSHGGEIVIPPPSINLNEAPLSEIIMPAANDRIWSAQLRAVFSGRLLVAPHPFPPYAHQRVSPN